MVRSADFFAKLSFGTGLHLEIRERYRRPR
jgi:hypothetical protein